MKLKIDELMRFCNYNPNLRTMRINLPLNSVYFPFTTRTDRRVKYHNGLKGVIGALIREIHGVSPEYHDFDFTEVVDKISTDNMLKQKLKRILQEFVSDTRNDLFSPKTMVFFPIANGAEGSVGEVGVADYLYHTLFSEFSDFDSFVTGIENEEENVISKLLSKHIESLPKTHYDSGLVYYKDNQIIELFQSDLRVLMSNKRVFIEYFEILLSYYFFYYILFTANNLVTKEDSNLSNLKIFYFSDWESASRSRESFKKGYSHVQNYISKNIYFHAITIEHFNIMFDVKGRGFKELESIFENLSLEEKSEAIDDLKLWFSEFSALKGLISPVMSYSDSFAKLYKDYVQLLKDYSRDTPGVSSRYSIGIEAIGKTNFLKKRGNLGNCLNVKHELLMLFVYIITNNRKVSLSSFFAEVEKRGVYLDKYSKDSIINYLDEINLIDKRSDSGEAQYVKSIL